VRLITVAAHRTALTIQGSKEVWSPPPPCQTARTRSQYRVRAVLVDLPSLIAPPKHARQIKLRDGTCGLQQFETDPRDPSLGIRAEELKHEPGRLQEGASTGPALYLPAAAQQAAASPNVSSFDPTIVTCIAVSCFGRSN
jgi:hypothetical protein